MAVVRDFYIGNTRVKICDDYCKDKTEEEVEEILRRCSQIAVDAWTAAGGVNYEESDETEV